MTATPGPARGPSRGPSGDPSRGRSGGPSHGAAGGAAAAPASPAASPDSAGAHPLTSTPGSSRPPSGLAAAQHVASSVANSPGAPRRPASQGPGTGSASHGATAAGAQSVSGASAAGAPAAGERSVATRARSTPDMLRRLSAAGLLAGVLTGAASFGSVLYGESAARSAADTLATSASATRAATAVADARAVAATAHLRAGSNSTQAVTTALADATAALAAVRTQDDELADQVVTAQRALPAFTVAAVAAVTPAGGTPDAAAGEQLRSADAALSEQTEVVTTLAASAGQQSVRPAQLMTALPLGIGGAAAVLLVGTGWWLARKTRRVVNPPLAVGTLLVIGAAGLGVAATLLPSGAVIASSNTGYLSPSATAHQGAAQARAAELSALLPSADVASATSAANDADARVQQVLTQDEAIGASSGAAWRTYAQAQVQVLSQVGSNRSTAITTSTGSGAGAFERFTASLPRVDANAALPTRSDAGAPWAWLALLGGVAGGALAWIGLDRRLKDYR